MAEFLSILNSYVLKKETIPHRISELDQIVLVSGHNFVDYVDGYVFENVVDNLVLLEQLDQD